MTWYERLISPSSLRAGWSRTREKSAMAGADGVSVRMFELRLEEELGRLHGELKAHSYQPQPLLRFDIPKADGSWRPLAIPAVRDRVVQASALLVLTPLIERELETSSFAYREGRSYTDAIARLALLRDEGYTWVVDADVDDFFDEVDHDLLLARFAEVMPDADVQALVRAWLTADAVHNGQRQKRTKGLPQGSAISPMLANLYLDHMDESLAEAGYRLVRYADDFVILCKSQPKAEKALRLTEELLSSLALRLHPEKTRITSFEEGFRFLGSLFVRSLVVPSKTKTRDAAPRSASKTVSAPETSRGASPEKSILVQPMPQPPADGLPDRSALEETALGRAFLRALDAEGVSVRDFVETMQPPPGKAPEAAPAALALSAPDPDELDPEAPIVLPPGAEPFMRTLYIQEQGTWLRINRGRFVVTAGREPRRERLALPAMKVDQILVFGSCLITPAALRYCLRRGIPITLLSSRGQYYGQVESAASADVSRQRLQFLRALDAPFRLELARRVVEAKLHNARSVLRRYARRRGDAALRLTARNLDRLMRQLRDAETLDQVRGYEGRGSALYFGAFDTLLEGSAFTFSGRNRRPPTDPVNAMLSLGYTLLFNNLYAFTRLHRLSPYVGFLHDERAGHPALVSDLVEEFRFLIDRLVLTLCNKRLLTPADFVQASPNDPTAGCFLTDAARKTFLRAFERALHRQVTHPGTGRTVTYRQCLDLQVRAFSRHLEGEEEYLPFTII